VIKQKGSQEHKAEFSGKKKKLNERPENLDIANIDYNGDYNGGQHFYCGIRIYVQAAFTPIPQEQRCRHVKWSKNCKRGVEKRSPKKIRAHGKVSWSPLP
jgi:hypothetical protein